MKNIRIWFKKDLECRYISHLDLNRCMLRAVHKSAIPIWHTEGFNPHPFLTFPLPLSLGFKGERESMDVRLLDESYSFEKIIAQLNACLPDGIRVFDVTEAKMKAGDIKSALFEMHLTSDELSADALYSTVTDAINQNELLVDKKTKSGIKQIDIKPYLTSYEVLKTDKSVKITITLPAGSQENINPMLLVTAIENIAKIELLSYIIRVDIFNAKGERFE